MTTTARAIDGWLVRCDPHAGRFEVVIGDGARRAGEHGSRRASPARRRAAPVGSRPSSTLTLERDPTGQVPLFHARGRAGRHRLHRPARAARRARRERRTRRAAPRRVAARSLARPEGTLLRGIRRVPAGHLPDDHAARVPRCARTWAPPAARLDRRRARPATAFGATLEHAVARAIDGQSGRRVPLRRHRLGERRRGRSSRRVGTAEHRPACALPRVLRRERGADPAGGGRRARTRAPDRAGGRRSSSARPRARAGLRVALARSGPVGPVLRRSRAAGTRARGGGDPRRARRRRAARRRHPGWTCAPPPTSRLRPLAARRATLRLHRARIGTGRAAPPRPAEAAAWLAPDPELRAALDERIQAPPANYRKRGQPIWSTAPRRGPRDRPRRRLPARTEQAQPALGRRGRGAADRLDPAQLVRRRDARRRRLVRTSRPRARHRRRVAAPAGARTSSTAKWREEMAQRAAQTLPELEARGIIPRARERPRFPAGQLWSILCIEHWLDAQPGRVDAGALRSGSRCVLRTSVTWLP